MSGVFPLSEQAFARACVKRAAKDATTRYVREWLKRDEFGTWEKEALDLMRSINAHVYSFDFIEEQIAARLRFMANTAVLNKSKENES